MNQTQIVHYLNQTLEIERYTDYCPNGLQVEGDGREVHKIALAVSLTEEVIEHAINWQADLLLCHHGILWNKQNLVIQGPYQRKIHKLLTHGIAAVAYHLPLDFHPELGNNAQFAKALGLDDIQGIMLEKSYHQGVMGDWPSGDFQALQQKVEDLLERKPQPLHFCLEPVHKVAIMTGGAQGWFGKALEEGADCYLTGEVSEPNYTEAQEWEKSFLACGHYATEQFGVKALGQLLQDHAGVETRFFKTKNPV